jgi:hypothetical protein
MVYQLLRLRSVKQSRNDMGRTQDCFILKQQIGIWLEATQDKTKNPHAGWVVPCFDQSRVPSGETQTSDVVTSSVD